MQSKLKINDRRPTYFLLVVSNNSNQKTFVGIWPGQDILGSTKHIGRQMVKLLREMKSKMIFEHKAPLDEFSKDLLLNHKDTDFNCTVVAQSQKLKEMEEAAGVLIRGLKNEDVPLYSGLY